MKEAWGAKEVIRNPFLFLRPASKLEPPLNNVDMKLCWFIGILWVEKMVCPQILWIYTPAPLKYFENTMLGWQAVTIYLELSVTSCD